MQNIHHFVPASCTGCHSTSELYDILWYNLDIYIFDIISYDGENGFLNTHAEKMISKD